jgi:outer membrane murein-binding lipoprotein Lpp
MKTITENTLIPISLVITVAGGASWLAAIKAKVDETTTSVLKMESKIDTLAQMRTDIEVIKTKVERMEQPIRNASVDASMIKRTLQFTGPIVPARFMSCPYNPALFTMSEKSRL